MNPCPPIAWFTLLKAEGEREEAQFTHLLYARKSCPISPEDVQNYDAQLFSVCSCCVFRVAIINQRPALAAVESAASLQHQQQQHQEKKSWKRRFVLNYCKTCFMFYHRL